MIDLIDAKTASKILAKLMRRQKPFSQQYIMQLTRNGKLIAAMKDPWRYEIKEIENYYNKCKKKLAKDNRSKRYFL
jgi:hypothetical protein